jgi:3-phosphoshikimate 1-carboxyvinyltransferase
MNLPPVPEDTVHGDTRWPDPIEINPSGPVHARIRPPGSKSITNRAIVISALASGHSSLKGALDSEDTRVMIEAWHQLGVAIDHDARRSLIQVTGCNGAIPARQAQLFLANSGTSMRFLTAAVALGHGVFRLDGVPRMRERPIEGLLQPLRSLGANTRSEFGTGCPPIELDASGLRGGPVRISGNESSQYTSALLMAAPYAAATTSIEIAGDVVSEPFVAMTVRVMEDFGVIVRSPQPGLFVVPVGAGYRGREYAIEPDATAASYFWTAAAITGGEVTVDGLDQSSVQGDIAFLDVLERMGAQVTRQTGSMTVRGGPLVGVQADMSAISDTVPTLAVAAVFANGPTTIRGVEHIRRQETDRIHAIVTELRRVGITVEEYPDGLTIHPTTPKGAVIETYNDHRIAMSFALAGLRIDGIAIANPGCTSKTYPKYFDDLAILRK